VTPFYKLSGAGNDFLALVEPRHPPTAAEIRAWCQRGLALGADGLFTLERTPKGARMVYWNADGSHGELCLNGSRCAAQLAYHLGWHQQGALDLETDAGIVAAQRIDRSSVKLSLSATLEPLQPTTLSVAGFPYQGTLVRVGVPHFVLPWVDDLANIPMNELGPALRSHPELGPEGANIQFVIFETSRHFAIRSFERGVENETLACGTGIVAAAAVGIAAGELVSPVTAHTARGFQLTVGGSIEDGCLGRPTLAGDARIVARGEIYPEAKEMRREKRTGGRG
jgi:diaminopimelate epimerase